MPSQREIDAAFKIAQTEARWSINKLPLVKRMLEAAAAAFAEEASKMSNLRNLRQRRSNMWTCNSSQERPNPWS